MRIIFFNFKFQFIYLQNNWHKSCNQDCQWLLLLRHLCCLVQAPIRNNVRLKSLLIFFFIVHTGITVTLKAEGWKLLKKHGTCYCWFKFRSRFKEFDLDIPFLMTHAACAAANTVNQIRPPHDDPKNAFIAWPNK